MKRFLLIAALTLAACSGADEPAEAVTCEQSDRSGTYLVQFSETSGNCGAIPDQLGRLDDATALPDTCSFDAADVWSEGDCKLERAFTCEEPGIGAGVTSRNVAVTEQKDSTGASIGGVVTISVVAADGTVMCKSTYDYSATRQ